jgi:PKD repeat protein
MLCGASAISTVMADSKAKADGAPSITADQQLSPGFDLGVRDYVIRCTGQPVVITVNAPSDTAVSVDHSAMRSGIFSLAVPLTTGQEFSIAVRRNDSTDHYHVRCLPQDFPHYLVEPDAPRPESLYTVDDQGRYIAIFDSNGVPVWWMSTVAGAYDFSVLADGTIGFYDSGARADQIYSLAGQPIRSLTAQNGSTDVHELQLLPDGDYIIDSYVPRGGQNLGPYGGPSDAIVLAGEIEELAPDGRLVWSWNSADPDHFTPADTAQAWYDKVLTGGGPYDTVHLNSIAVDGNLIVASARHTDAVWGIDRTTGQILWKLGGTTNSYSLAVHGDPQSYPLSGQHDARVLDDGTITLHDNNTLLGLPPRAVHYQIAAPAGTATLLDSLSDPSDIAASACCGSARRTSSGGWLIAWGSSSVVAAYDADGNRLSKVTFSGFVYRALPVPDSTTIDDVRAAMDRRFPRVDADVPPVASLAASPNPVMAGGTVSFDANASYDQDGVVTSYDWDFGDASAGSGAGPTHVYSRPGDYLVRLTVHDDSGAAAEVNSTVTVLGDAMVRPTALFVATPARTLTHVPISLDGSASYATDSTILSWRWRFGDGSSATGMMTGHAYSHSGAYAVTLTVVNGAGLADTTTRIVQVADRSAVAVIRLSPIHPHEGARVSMRAQAHDPDGHVVAYHWTFGDGGRGRGRHVRHVYRHPGRYRVTLRVTDDTGSVTVRRRPLRVGEPEGAPVGSGSGFPDSSGSKWCWCREAGWSAW